ncbi:MAG: peptidase M50 [Oscillibacter sp.]|nr:peptidase M50 [Oscillibacter sp.]
MKIVYILAAILIFGVLIAVHELGHFLAAKLCGVRVNEFSIGMGPLLWKKEGEETRYTLRLLPIGGFCAMEGEDEDTGDQRSFVRQGFWKKFVILAAGAFMNFLTGVLVLLILFGGASAFYVDQIAGFAEGFPLEGENGLMVGDVIYKIDGYRTYLHGDASLFLRYNDGKGVDLVVIRDGEKISLKDFPMYRSTYEGQPERFGLSVGVKEVPATFFTKIQYAWYQAVDFVQLVWFSLVQLVTGNAGMNDLSGPVGIVSTITEVGEASATVRIAVENIAYFAALIAVNLAVMNLLPIPALDGGRIFFLAVDAAAMALFRRKVPEKYQAAVNMAGFVVLMGFMLLVTVHDVFRLFQ